MTPDMRRQLAEEQDEALDGLWQWYFLPILSLIVIGMGYLVTRG